MRGTDAAAILATASVWGDQGIGVWLTLPSDTPDHAGSDLLAHRLPRLTDAQTGHRRGAAPPTVRLR